MVKNFSGLLMLTVAGIVFMRFFIGYGNGTVFEDYFN